MYDEHLPGLIHKACDKTDQAVLIRMAADAVHGLNMGPDVDFLAEYFHRLRPVLEKTAQRSLRLVSGENYGTLLSPEIVL